MKILTTLFLILILSPLAVFAQQQQQQQQQQEARKWTKIASPKGDFTVALPPDFLVDNEEDNSYSAYAFHNEARMDVEIERDSDPKIRLKMMRQFPSHDRKVRITRFEMGDFSGDMYIYEKKKGISISIYMASPHTFIRVYVYAREETTAATAKNFLYSIRLNDQPLFKNQPNNIPDTGEAAVSIASLKTSPIVLNMLKIKDASNVPVKYALEDKKKEEEEEEEDLTPYSRPLIALRKPRAPYSDKARQKDIKGSVRLKIFFKPDGQIGEITVLQKLDGGLTEEAIKAARKIKFVPAEVGGAPVAVNKEVEYTFTLY
ncbi:MAG: energy transducer TonB [Acidobacteriota bacterium]|nr:energy transducer TonB [Acidobacteriota bacterium]